MDDMLMKTITDTDHETSCPHCGSVLLEWEKPKWEVDDNYCFIHWTVYCCDCQSFFSVSEDYKCVERRIYYSKENEDEKDSD